MKMKFLACGLTLATLLAASFAPAHAAHTSTTASSPPVPAGYYQGWYSRYVVVWNGGLDFGTYSIQIQTTYITDSDLGQCNLALSQAMSVIKIYQWSSCTQML